MTMWSKLGTPVQSLIVGAAVMIVVWLISPYLPENQRGSLRDAPSYGYRYDGAARGAGHATTGWRL
jgi:hypothetical protein